jgi:CheY-like chemotaxis protein
VHSEPGRGSTFNVTILVSPDVGASAESAGPSGAADAAGARPAAASGATPQRTRTTVLLAEDNPDNRRLIKSVLERAGVGSELCEDGTVAVARLSSLLKAGRPPDLVLMDVHMPGIDGFEASRIIRESGYDGPIVALTANVREGEWDRCKEAGINDLLAKPIDRPRLIAAVQGWTRATDDPPDSPDEAGAVAARQAAGA